MSDNEATGRGMGRHEMLSQLVADQMDRDGPDSSFMVRSGLLKTVLDDRAALLEALLVIRGQWAGHEEECAYVQDYDNKCDCAGLKIAAQCDAAISAARGAV